jgi:hypothetical protein
MPKADNYQPVFDALRQILQKHAPRLVVAVDTPGNYSLNTRPTEKSKNQPGYFGGAHIRKGYVSYYLMPVYVYPELLTGLSPELKKRMQGKSCFNFSAVDQGLFKELAALTRQGFDQYRREKWL